MMRRPNMSAEDKARIVALFQEGLSARAICAKVDWSIGSVHRVLARYLPERERRPARKINRSSILARARRHGLGVWSEVK